MTPAQSQPTDSEQNKTSKIKVVETDQDKADEPIPQNNQMHHNHKSTKPWVNLSGIDLPGWEIRTRQWMPTESHNGADTSLKAAEKTVNHNEVENEDVDVDDQPQPGTSNGICGTSGGGRLFSERGRATKVNPSVTIGERRHT